MFDLPPELADLQLPQYRPSLAPRTPVELPWHDEESWESWLKDPVWLRRAFTADKDHLNSVLMTKPIGDLLSIAYLKSVRNSVHRVGLSYLASFTGPHRTAKSTSACLFAHIWDPTFWGSFEQRVVQSPYQFMTTMDSIRKDKIIGAAVVVDEAGTTFASGDWYEKWMRSIQKVLQICGLLKPVILFVAPNREFIVSGMRKLIVAEHHMKRFDPRFTRMSCYQVKYNFMKKGDPYIFKRPIIRIAGQNITLKHINIYEPPAWFIDRYKNLTEPEKQSRLDKFSEEVRKNISDQEEEEPDYDQLIEEIWQKKEIYFGSVKRDGTQTIDQTAIEIGFSIKPKHAKYIKERIERRLLENKKQVEDFSLRQQEADAERLAIEKEKRMKRLKSMEADDLAADGTDEQAEQIEDMGDDLEKELSSTDD